MFKKKFQFIAVLTSLLILLTAFTGCKPVNDIFYPPDSGGLQLRDVVTLVTLQTIFQNPCDSVPKPTLISAQSTVAALAGTANVSGRIVTQSGQPVNGALVLLDDETQHVLTVPTFYFSTHSGINGDGSFFISGVPIGHIYDLSIAPIQNIYTYRIERHIDCRNPSVFTAAWYTGDGNTVSGLYPDSVKVDIPGGTPAGTTFNVGTLVTIE